MKAGNYQTKTPSVNDLLFGTKNSTGETVNFKIQDVVNLTQTPSIVSTNTLIAATISNINTYFTGTTGAQFDVTLPTASANIDGLKYVIMSTATRLSTTWITPGATIVGAPSTLTADTPVCFQYNNSDTTWYISM
jgi:ribosomal protein S8E